MPTTDEPLISAQETDDDLIIGGYRIRQARNGYRFSLDAVLLAHFPHLDNVRSVLDVGTGNGVIPLILSALSSDLNITGIEIQHSMAGRARINVAANHLKERIKIVEANICDYEKLWAPQSFDLILSNPPFFKIGTGKVSSNHEKRWARHEFFLDLPRLFAAFKFLLHPLGKGVLIHRAERREDIEQNAKIAALQVVRYQEIRSRLRSTPQLCLWEFAHPNLEIPLTVEEPLVIYDEKGEYSSVIKRYYQK